MKLLVAEQVSGGEDEHLNDGRLDEVNVTHQFGESGCTPGRFATSPERSAAETPDRTGALITTCLPACLAARISAVGGVLLSFFGSPG